MPFTAAMSDDQSDLDPSEDEELSPTSPPSPSMEYSAPISAVPPRVMLQEEGQMEVSASPAFQCLDDVSLSYQHNQQIFMTDIDYILTNAY